MNKRIKNQLKESCVFFVFMESEQHKFHEVENRTQGATAAEFYLWLAKVRERTELELDCVFVIVNCGIIR